MKSKKEMENVLVVKQFGKRNFVDSLIGDGKDVEIKNVEMGELIKDNAINIPTFQRELDWTAKKTVTLLQDLINNPGRIDDLGLYIFFRDQEGDLATVDGQQRLTSTILALAVCREYAIELASKEKNNENKKAYEKFVDSMENHYLNFYKKDKGVGVPVLRSEQLGGEMLESIMTGKITTSEIPRHKKFSLNPWQKRTLSSYSAIYNWMKKNKICPLRLAEKILFGVTITRAIYPTVQQAIRSYIKVNTMQTPLSYEDIIKALVYEKADSKKLENQWTFVKRGFDNEKDFEKYVLNVLKAYYPAARVTKSTAAQIFEDLVASNRLDVKEFVEKLNGQDNVYKEIIGKADNELNYKNKLSFDIQRLLGFDTQYPLFLIASELEDKKFYEEIVQEVMWMQFERQTVLKQDARSSGVTGMIDSVIAILQSNATDTTKRIGLTTGAKNQIRSIFKQNRVAHEDVRDAFSRLLEEKISPAKAKGILLLQLEKTELLSDSEMKLNLKKIDVDHIFPKNSEKRGYVTKEQAEKVYNLTNCQVMHSGANRGYKDTHPSKKVTNKKSVLNANSVLYSTETENMDLFTIGTKENFEKEMVRTMEERKL